MVLLDLRRFHSTALPQWWQTNWRSSSIPGGAAWGAPQSGQTTAKPLFGD
jgi:hypothetical protein